MNVNLLLSSLHLFHLLSSHVFLHHPSFNPTTNASPPPQRTTSLPRLSSGGSTVVETLWEWRGSRGAPPLQDQAPSPVPWNPEGAGDPDPPGGTCSISPQPSPATRWDGSMVLII